MSGEKSPELCTLLSILGIHWNHLKTLKDNIASEPHPEFELGDLGKGPSRGMLEKHPGASTVHTGLKTIALNLKLIQATVKWVLISLSCANFYLRNKLLELISLKPWQQK